MHNDNVWQFAIRSHIIKTPFYSDCRVNESFVKDFTL